MTIMLETDCHVIFETYCQSGMTEEVIDESISGLEEEINNYKRLMEQSDNPEESKQYEIKMLGREIELYTLKAVKARAKEDYSQQDEYLKTAEDLEEKFNNHHQQS